MAPQRLQTRKDVLPVSTVGVGVGIDQLRESVDETVVQWALLRMEIGGGDFSRIKLVALAFNSDEIPAVSRSRQNLRTPKVLQRFGEVHATVELHQSADITRDSIEERVMRIFGGDHLNVNLPRLGFGKDNGLQKAYKVEYRYSRDPIRSMTSNAVKEEGVAGVRPTGVATETHAVGESTKDRPIELSAEEALSLVAGNDEKCNWVVLEPETMSVHAHGKEGIDEMKACLVEDQVLYGLLRVAFASPEGDNRRLAEDTGGKARRLTKHVFVHWVGPNVGAVKRGRHIAKRSDAEIQVRKFCAYALAVTAHRKQDLALEDCISELQRLTVLDVGTGSHRSTAKGTPPKIEDASLAAPAVARCQSDSDGSSDQQEFKQADFFAVETAVKPQDRSRAKTPAEELPEPGIAIEVVRSGNGAWEWVLLGPVPESTE